MGTELNDGRVIQEGKYVVVKMDSSLRLVELKKCKPVFLGKRKAILFSGIGHHYGTFFEIKPNGNLSKLDKPDSSRDILDPVDRDPVKDNRSLTNTGLSQKLTTEDIEAFKAQGLSGEEMVKKIVENSSTFQEKTAFAKEKYLRKKQKKYLNHLQLLKPNIRLLAEMLYMQDPLKICNLRLDSLSQMLTFCNILHGGKYLVLETVQGLLAAAVLERLGTDGRCIQIHLGPYSAHSYPQIIKALDVPDGDIQSMYLNVDLQSVMHLLNDEESACSVENMDVDSSTSANPTDVKKANFEAAKEFLDKRNLDGLLIAIKNYPLPVLSLIDFLNFSRPFAIFSTFQEPLVHCYENLKARGDIISLNISETWLRKYQVLPDRTHPCYNMSGGGGFLLTGIKVEPKPDKKLTL